MGSTKTVAGRSTELGRASSGVSRRVGALLPGPDNVAVVRGRVARPPVVRPGEQGEVVVAWELTVAGVKGGARSEAVPVVWASPAMRAGSVEEGDDLVVVGRVRRRFFRSGGVVQSRTEVVAHDVIPSRQRAKVSRALAEVAARLAGGPG